MTDEKRREIAERKNQLMKWAMSISEEQRNYLVNAGFLNDAIKGYCILAAQYAGFDEGEISRLIDGMRTALECNSADDAAQEYNDF